MRHPFVLTLAALCLTLFIAVPGWGSSLQIWESSNGAPGVTAVFTPGSGLIADLDFDADSAEGGQLPVGGPSDIEISPTGSLILVAFTCQFTGCTAGSDYVFTPGGAGTGQLIVSDTNSSSPENGVFDIGQLEFDVSGVGTLELLTCHYFANGQERTCDPFQLVNVPEPTTGALFALGLGIVATTRRRRA